MALEIAYSTGRVVEVETMDAAWTAITATYPEAFFLMESGMVALAYPDEAETEELKDNAHNGARIMVWENEEQSMNDPGVFAVACIRWVN